MRIGHLFTHRKWALAPLFIIGTVASASPSFHQIGQLPTSESRIYVANTGSDNVSVIDAATHQPVATIALTSIPTSLALSPDRQKLYVADAGLTIINTATNKIEETIPLQTSPQKWDWPALAVSPNGQHVFVPAFPDSSKLSGSIYVVDTVTKQLVSTIPTASPVGALAVSPDGQLLVATTWNADNQNIVGYVFNANSDAFIGSIAIDESKASRLHPSLITFTPNGRYFYVASGPSLAVNIYEVAKLNSKTYPSASVPTAGINPISVVFNADGTKGYISDSFCTADSTSCIEVVDTATNSIVGKVILASWGDPHGHGPISLALSTINPELYAAIQATNSLAVLDPDTLQPIVTITTGNSPEAVTAS